MQRKRFLTLLIIVLYSIVWAKSTPLSQDDLANSDESNNGEKAAQSFEDFPHDDDDDDDDADHNSNDRDIDSDLDDEDHLRVQDHNWDVLIFTQQWPVTTCYHWRENNPNQECELPQKKEFWTIHGIWPTKLGQLGPDFCNRTVNFNITQLDGIEQQLQTFWPDLKGPSSQEWLWEHEWLKHGTCAMALTELDNELKYFDQGLAWREEYVMSRILDLSDIHPDSNNTVVAINNAIVKVLHKQPSIHCLFDGKHEISYLSEIRICFNKSLELIDCDGVKMGDARPIHYPSGSVITNCHIGSPVHYPSLLPPLLRKENNSKTWKFPLVNVYKLLQFLMWFTL
ncbi:ribonuclease T2 [Drosophila tropicalis]|uniref:ribonuclease T2 n=1 Tax=Drosophila tropicalis TaxID=46794 RepID=UPI0035ABB706